LPTAEAGRRSIVELKSGSPFMPNIHGISSNHFIQTALYDLLIRSTFGSNIHLGSYILYSKLDERPLRFAPASKIQQYEALQVRNQLLAIERMIAALGQGEADLLEQAELLFGRLSVARYPDISGFARNHLLLFEQVWQQLSAFEKRYFAAFAGMNARENALAKTGVQGQDKINGLASLWLDEADDKEQNFNWMRGLQVLENHAGSVEPIISFRRTERTNPLANFRLGDIALLYPERGDAEGALTNQIFKCSIVVLEEDRVAVKLRARQFNDRLFREYTHWVLEHDTSDLSFTYNYRGLFAFAQAPAAVRQRLLGLRPPAEAAAWQGSWPSVLTEEQTALLNRMVKAEEYFLLWGPPGTGKTSLILHHLVRYLLENSAENLLLLAYTNRAVDEICETIEHIGSEEALNYVRIGSGEGTDLRFRAKLLQNLTTGLGSRKALLALLAKTRVVVGTVASVMGKQDLFEVKKFDRLIIDEASQILEPGLIGLLTRFPRCVLIGDHRQLPAVVTQAADASVVKDVSLQQQGFANLRDSLFERLYRQCQQRGWHWAYAQLSRQGRMHTDIMQFPATAFYDGRLDILHNNLRQQQALNWQLPAAASHYDRWMAQHRLLFIPAAVDELSPTLKTNRFEAEIIAELVASYLRLMKANQRTPDAGSIGIITPYRAQIALIRHVLQEKGITTEFPLTIDTVERYQGGARDVILVSLCTNAARQLTTLSSLSEEGVDRKLNVAMTRAREQLLIIGNPDLLARSPVYRQLLTYCRQHAAWATTADPEGLPA
jgi:DNA replication ATP-dependent helicase Dna2